MDVNENNKEPQPPVEPKDDLKVNANAFGEERRALLDGMATQLQDVIQKMARVNKNLQNITDDSDAVSQVAKLWRESYQIANEIGRKADDKSEQQSQQPQSSLLIYDRSV